MKILPYIIGYGIVIYAVILTFTIQDAYKQFSQPANMVEVKQDNYTLWKLCLGGKTAAEEISADGSKIIRLPCQSEDINRL